MEKYNNFKECIKKVAEAFKNTDKTKKILLEKKLEFAVIGDFGGTKISFTKNSANIINLSVDKARLNWMNSLEELVHG